MVGFENRSGAADMAVSTGSAEGRHLQPSLGQFTTTPHWWSRGGSNP